MTIRRVEPNRDYDGPDDHAAGYEGRLRVKMESGEPLDGDEGRYLAHLEGSQNPHARWRPNPLGPPQ